MYVSSVFKFLDLPVVSDSCVCTEKRRQCESSIALGVRTQSIREIVQRGAGVFIMGGKLALWDLFDPKSETSRACVLTRVRTLLDPCSPH